MRAAHVLTGSLAELGLAVGLTLNGLIAELQDLFVVSGRRGRWGLFR
jgi:hypothetical protein